MKRHRMQVISLLLMFALIVMMASPIASIAAGQPTVDLGSASSFAVLAGSGITNTGPTTVDGDAGGDMGSDPTGTFTGQAEVTLSGAVHLADAESGQAKTDLITAYDDAAGRGPVTTIPSELGGQTLTPGTYDSADGTFEITGTLTLDAEGDPDGVFVFQMASTLNTAVDSSVELINSARYCRTFWQVGSSATLGVDSTFVGHIFALQSITANNGAFIQGQLLARNGAVTLDSNTITNGVCDDTPAPRRHRSSSSASSEPPLINVVKIPEPLALTAGSGSVTYTYKVTNPGNVYLSDVTVTDDKVSPVTYVSGDVNNDEVLQSDEIWIYTSRADLEETTVNIATATGVGNNMTATDIAEVTVVVTPIVPIYPPIINIIKIPDPLALPEGKGLVSYTYEVSNPGMVALSNVTVTDDKVFPVTYSSGDANEDGLLQESETWIYTGNSFLTETTSNIATAKGSANEMTATDLAYATVIVRPPAIVIPPVVVIPPTVILPEDQIPLIDVTPPVVTETVTGGELPRTSSPWYNLLMVGLALAGTGVYGWKRR